MDVHAAALKHGVSADDGIQAAQHPVFVAYLDDDSPARQLRLGFDSSGRLLETVVLVFDSGNDCCRTRFRRSPVVSVSTPAAVNRPSALPADIAFIPSSFCTFAVLIRAVRASAAAHGPSHGQRDEDEDETARATVGHPW